jgi:hypothetical protein
LADGRHPEDLRRQVAEILDFMDEHQEGPEVWASFLAHTADRDRIRAESFAEAFPEYHAELVRAGAWYPEQPVSVAGRRSAVRIAARLSRPARRLLHR